MRALIVYESMFGNNRSIAEAIAGGMAPQVTVEVTEVGAAPSAIPPDIDLLVVGGPNHAFGMSRESTRQQAAQEAEGPLVSSGVGLREWLEAMPDAVRAIPCAAFDSRVDKGIIRTVDRTAGMIAKRLKKRGFRRITEVASFYVEDMKGPLVEGELDRAREWGQELARLATATAVG
jgi:flavodoxin